MSEHLTKALEEIKKCEHYAIKDLSKTMDSEERIIYIGMLAERINKIERPKNISQKIKALREAKGL